MMRTRSRTTEALIEALRGVNESISYSDLATRVKVPIVDMKKSLPSARKILLEEKILFEPIRGFGLARLNDEGKVIKSETNKRRLRSGSKRSLKELEAIHSYEGLSNNNQLRVTINRTLFSMILADPDPVKERPVATKQDVAANVINIPKLKP